MNNTILHSTLRELQRILALPRLWIIFGVVVALFSATGPFGTYDSLQNVTRVGYWLLVHGFAWFFALFFITLTDRALEKWIAHALTRLLIGAAIAALPIALVINTANWALLNKHFLLSDLGESFLNALAVSLPLSVLVWMSLDSGTTQPLEKAEAVTTPSNQPKQTLQRPRLLDRLPREKRGSLIRLEVQDHYVQVITTNGREMVLLRLADAIAETAPLEGRQVHRSHWVARHPANTLSRGNGKNAKLTIQTADGATIPVSRTYGADAKTWFT